MKNQLRLFFLLTTLFFSSSAQKAEAQKLELGTFGDGIINAEAADKSWSLKMGARFQFQTSGTYYKIDSEENEFNTNAVIRRARLKFDGYALSPTLRYKIELALSNHDIAIQNEYNSDSPGLVLDAFLDWNFYKNLTLSGGQAKLPGNVERVVSSANLQFVDRSILNSQFNIDRDLGFQLKHHFTLGNEFLIRETLAITRGEGRNVTTENLGGAQYTGRLEFLPLGSFINNNEYVGSALERENAAKLMIGTTYNFNNGASKTRGNMGTIMETSDGIHQANISTLFIDAVFKYRSFSFLGEYAQRFCDDPIVNDIDESGNIYQAYEVSVGKGLNLQAGYLFNSNWELAARFSQTNMDKASYGTEDEKQYTIGVSKYIRGHKLKMQTDFSLLDSNTGTNEYALRLQFDIHL